MQPARTLIIAGLVLFALGLIWLAAERLGFGRLPGDLVVRRKNFTLYVPILSSIIASVVLTLLLRWFKR